MAEATGLGIAAGTTSEAGERPAPYNEAGTPNAAAGMTMTDAESEALHDDTERTGPGGTGEAINVIAETEWIDPEAEAFNTATEITKSDDMMVEQDEAAEMVGPHRGG